MPRFDGTGPLGFGPGTGWGLGPCGLGFGWRRGFWGRGGWRRFWWRSKTKKEELEALRDYREALQEELREVEEEEKALQEEK